MFANDAGIIEIDCDAPPYPVVQACRELGFRSPEDVAVDRLGIALPAQKKRRGILEFPAAPVPVQGQSTELPRWQKEKRRDSR